MPYKTKHVMNTILQRAFREGRSDMSPMKAQKILFYVHGWHLATRGEPAIDKPFEVWQYGPVVEEVYSALKKYKGGPITGYIPEDSTGKPLVIHSECEDIYTSIDIAWEKYIGIPAVNLSAMTHEPGSPWDLAKNRGLNIIPNDTIREYFVRLAQHN